MKFTNQDYEYLYGKKFSNGYTLKLQNNRLQSRLDKLKEIVKGKSVLHVGCCDHVPLIANKIKQGTWLHGILEATCKDVLGIDINDEAVRYVNSNGFSQKAVLCADITASDFCEKIPTDKRFDYVLLGEIVEHVDNPVAFLRAMDANVKKTKICPCVTTEGGVYHYGSERSLHDEKQIGSAENRGH